MTWREAAEDCCRRNMSLVDYDDEDVGNALVSNPFNFGRNPTNTIWLLKHPLTFSDMTGSNNIYEFWLGGSNIAGNVWWCPALSQPSDNYRFNKKNSQLEVNRRAQCLRFNYEGNKQTLVDCEERNLFMCTVKIQSKRRKQFHVDF